MSCTVMQRAGVFSPLTFQLIISKFGLAIAIDSSTPMLQV